MCQVYQHNKSPPGLYSRRHSQQTAFRLEPAPSVPRCHQPSKIACSHHFARSSSPSARANTMLHPPAEHARHDLARPRGLFPHCPSQHPARRVLLSRMLYPRAKRCGACRLDLPGHKLCCAVDEHLVSAHVLHPCLQRCIQRFAAPTSEHPQIKPPYMCLCKRPIMPVTH